MKNYLFSLIKHFAFWLLLFIVGRILFLIANFQAGIGLTFGNICLSFVHALRLDVSAACYLTIFPFLLLTIALCFSNKWLDRLLMGYYGVMLLPLIIIYFADAFLYGEWLVKLNSKSLEYLRHPAEILQTATWWQTCIVILGTIILWFLFFLLYKKRIAKPPVERIKKRFAIAPAVLLLGG
ncbi:MAG: hypothetical protein LBV46_03895, partial [Bacteroidales bacterium]|nr:hypothetical protein [Bacteroidales bacterium]